MNHKNRSFAPIAILVGTLGLGSVAIAGFTLNRSPNSTIAQNSDGMMNHGGMNHGSTMNHSMDVGPADANYELRFIDSMVPHHQGALVMAQEVIQKSKRSELIKFAKNIITEQKKEIAQMQQWRKQWYPTASATPMMWHTEMNHQMAMTAEHKQSMMMSMSLGKADAGFDKRFLDAMIPHHQGAVTMAQDSLKKSKRPELQKLSQSIIKSQQSEIDRMNQWRQSWYGK
ncbi:DUF305 domain-containing protein [Chamaesiphon minutus]|uniref:DUF305 domain-containing protein n=1 Tax=Chamaesiphon minutus (strain ATCC 27169 / PCC 6605) TaxID=1173020 RepID=K9UAC9_CHAP6|nr:DUF305 domain-containing protein [Chamaesiphon minutus]AFY91371.1 hypothetical protein Cha6605_0064 [Chamaesiphon minutus PCC 6605]